MKSNKIGFTVIELLVCIVILAIFLALAFPLVDKIHNWGKDPFGREISKPENGQTYLVVAVDKSENTVIVMPWKHKKDGPVLTDRRLFFRVESNVCDSGIWFTQVSNGLAIVIDSPISLETNINQ